MSSRSKPIVTTIEEPKLIRRGAKLTIIYYILSLPTKSMDVPIIVVNTRVEELEKLAIPKPIPST
jgi:hypothetical protein